MNRLALGLLEGDPSGLRRPVTAVAIGETALPCLIDSGAARTRFPEWIADLNGIEPDEDRGITTGLGGTVVTAYPASVVLRTVAGTYPTVAWFCRGWRSEFGLLGQEGFLDRYRLTLDVAEGWFALQPSRGASRRS